MAKESRTDRVLWPLGRSDLIREEANKPRLEIGEILSEFAVER